MSSSPDDRASGGPDAAAHFAEAQSELFEGIRSILRGSGVFGELFSVVASFGSKRDELVRRATLERLRTVLVEERDTLPADDEPTRRAFGAVVAVLDRELEGQGAGGKASGRAGSRVQEVSVR